MTNLDNTTKSLRLIAALALASHAPTIHASKSENDITQDNPDMTSDCSSLSSRSSTDLDSLINDPIFTQALDHIRESAKTPLARFAFHDPRVVRAIQHACQTMRQPEIAALAQERNAQWNGPAKPKSLAAISIRSAPSSVRNRPTTP